MEPSLTIRKTILHFFAQEMRAKSQTANFQELSHNNPSFGQIEKRNWLFFHGSKCIFAEQTVLNYFQLFGLSIMVNTTNTAAVNESG